MLVQVWEHLYFHVHQVHKHYHILMKFVPQAVKNKLDYYRRRKQEIHTMIQLVQNNHQHIVFGCNNLCLFDFAKHMQI